MTRLFHPFLALIASSTDRELARYIEYLKEENKILRAPIPGQVHTKPEERKRLLKLGKELGKAIEELITIVKPATFYRWIRDESEEPTKKRKGGQRKSRELRELVIEIAKQTGFGYTRIIGELRKMGIKRISRQTIRNILKEEGIEPSPDRTSDSWTNFLERHAGTLWACDFFSVKTVTARGIREVYLLAFICLETREAIVSPGTEHPNSAWVVDQTEDFLSRTSKREQKPSIVIHDRDTKFTKEFVAKLDESDVRTNALPKASPNLNGRCERFIQTIKLECLAKFVIFGTHHLDHLVNEFVAYYNNHRSHSSRESLPPIRHIPVEVATVQLDDVIVKTHVGGLVKSFERKAA